MAKNTSPAVRVSAQVTLNLRTTEELFFFQEALYESMLELFEIDIVTTAKELAPVLSKATSERFPGELRESIDAHVRKNVKGASAVVFTDCGYGGHVELGTVRTPAQPFIYPAFELNIAKLLPLLEEALGSLAPGEKSGG